MTYAESVIFRAIPVVMMGVCLGFGGYVWSAADTAGNVVAGRVVTALAAICVCLFCTAATIIRQLIERYGTVDRILYPVIGYAVSLATAVLGARLFLGASSDGPAPEYVAGHVVFGIGLICGCVSTVATASTKFSWIPVNSSSPEGVRPPEAFSTWAALVLLSVPVVLAVVAWGVALAHLFGDTTAARFTVGHVVAGLAFVCTSLIGLVGSIVRQVQNSYAGREHVLWPWMVILMGTSSTVWGLVLLVTNDEPYAHTPGFVMVGLGLVCFSILSKVGLLSLVWRRTFGLARRVPLVPVSTALACLFLAAFVFEAAVADADLFVAARVLVGLGAVCFTLYSIVSILESGTSSPDQ